MATPARRWPGQRDPRGEPRGRRRLVRVADIAPVRAGRPVIRASSTLTAVAGASAAESSRCGGRWFSPLSVRLELALEAIPSPLSADDQPGDSQARKLAPDSAH